MQSQDLIKQGQILHTAKERVDSLKKYYLNQIKSNLIREKLLEQQKFALDEKGQILNDKENELDLREAQLERREHRVQVKEELDGIKQHQ